MSIKSMVRNPLTAAVLGAVAVAVPAGALYLSGSTHIAEAAGPQTVIAAQPATAAASVAALPDFRSLVQQYGPAVVNVSVRADGKSRIRACRPASTKTIRCTATSARR